MSGRRSLTDLLGPAPEPQAPPPPPATPPVTAPEPAVQAEPPTPPRKARDKRTTVTVPLYRTMQRMDARLRPDQCDGLSLLSRRLERARPTGQGARITDNTLLRVAVAVVLEHGKDLTGATEEELLASLRRALAG